jgi:hypothetical protein
MTKILDFLLRHSDRLEADILRYPGVCTLVLAAALLVLWGLLRAYVKHISREVELTVTDARRINEPRRPETYTAIQQLVERVAILEGRAVAQAHNPGAVVVRVPAQPTPAPHPVVNIPAPAKGRKKAKKADPEATDRTVYDHLLEDDDPTV